MDCIISIMTMSSNATNEVYTVDKIDGEELKRFVTERNVWGFMHKVCDCMQTPNRAGVVFFLAYNHFFG